MDQSSASVPTGCTPGHSLGPPNIVQVCYRPDTGHGLPSAPTVSLRHDRTKRRAVLITDVAVVVSFHETPSSEHPEDEEWSMEELVNTRSNTTSVLCQLSKHGAEDFERRLLSLKPVRQAMPPSDLDSNTACEGSSNLFYYLFEDYSSALPVLRTSKRELGRLVSHRDRVSTTMTCNRGWIPADTKLRCRAIRF